MEPTNRSGTTRRGMGELTESLSQIQKRLPPARENSSSEPSDAEKLAAKCVSSISGDLGKRYSQDRVSLKAFTIYDARQKPILTKLKKLLGELPDWADAGEGMVFYGTVGAGKDHLMAASLYAAAAKGVSCRWVNGQEIYGRFRDQIASDSREEELLKLWCEPQVLAISDPAPPAGDATRWNLQQLYRLLDRRYRALKSTWITLNALTLEQADARLSAPAFDRLRDGSHLFGCFWPSYRERRLPSNGG